MELTDHDLKDMANRIIVEDLIIANTFLKLSAIGNVIFTVIIAAMLFI